MRELSEVELLSVRLEQTFRKVDQYGSTLHEGSFHGPSLMDALSNVTYIEADNRLIPQRHNIWEIVNHCTYWMNETARAITEDDLRNVDEYEDWPGYEPTKSNWVRDMDKLCETYDNLKKLLCELKESRLDDIIESSFHKDIFKFTLRKMLYGIIDHNLYHTGQISLLKQSKRIFSR